MELGMSSYTKYSHTLVTYRIFGKLHHIPLFNYSRHDLEGEVLQYYIKMDEKGFFEDK